MDVNPEHAEVYSIDRAEGIRASGGDRITYVPFVDFQHAVPNREGIAYYQLRRCASPLDGGVDTYLAVVTPRSTPVDLAADDETLSLDLTCTNRFLPVT